MKNHNKAQQSKNRVHISWDILYDNTDPISGQVLFYNEHRVQKRKESLRIWRILPQFVPIGVFITTNDDGIGSDVTIGMWRYNQQVTNPER